MTGREWKPGDVAMSDQGVVLRCAFRGGPGWTYDDGSGRPGNNPGPLRPLVVIDPESEEDVDRLLAALDMDVDWLSMQAALREFANPKPPKPEEPTGLGAVVEDSDGNRWVKTLPGVERDQCEWIAGFPSSPYPKGYADIDAVRVLSEGVRP